MYWLNRIFRFGKGGELFINLGPLFNSLFGCPSKVPTNCRVITIGREKEFLAKP